MVDNCTRDFSPVSMKIVSTFGGFVPAATSHLLGIDYKTSIRLRGGGYRTYSNLLNRPKSAKWQRHWLNYTFETLRRFCGRPGKPNYLPSLKISFTLPEGGATCPYRYGVVHHMVLEYLKPSDF